MNFNVENITKKFKDKYAVKDISFELTPGVYGLLGENGAGKTTLMRMICSILRPTYGRITLDGKDILELDDVYSDQLGFLPQNFGYYPEFTALEFLIYMGALKGLSKVKAEEKSIELLKLVSLYDVKDKKIKTFSGGMKQRVGIAQAMLNDPKILVLDEPTAGLDPKERVRFRNIISTLASNRVVILSTHIVSDIEYIANRVLIMKAGEIILDGSIDEITKQIYGNVWNVKVPVNLADELNIKYCVSNLKTEGDIVELRIVSKNKPLDDAVEIRPTLEDLYIYCFREE